MSQELPFTQQVRNTANVTLDVLLSNLAANIGIAYGQANTATTAAATALSVAQAAYAQANVGILIAEEAYDQANTATTAAAAANTVGKAAFAQANNAYATANIGISASGVTAGSYGSGSQIPVFTVDARGRITTITTVSYNLFTPTSPGIVKASGGGTTNFLRADGNWAAPAFVVAQSLGLNGYRKYSDGYIEQWGRFTMSGGSTPITFPIAFPTACFEVNLTAASVTGAEYTNGYPTTSGFTAVNDGNPVLMMWSAKGN